MAKYKKAFASLKVDPGMKVDAEELARIDFDIKEYLSAQNLVEILSIKDVCYDELVKEFYSNCYRKKKEGPVVGSKVRGVEIKLSPKILKDMFGLVNDGFAVEKSIAKNVKVDGYDEIVFRTQVLQEPEKNPNMIGSNMRALPRFLHLIIVHNLVPKARPGVTGVTSREKIILWHILEKKPVNFSKLILSTILDRVTRVKSMVRRRHNKRPNLPFGLLLTKIFRHHEVPIYKKDKGFQCIPMGVQYLKHMAFNTKNRGWILKKFRSDDDAMIEENKTEEEEDLTQQELDENQILSPSRQEGNELPHPMLVENSVEEIEQHKVDGSSDADAEPEEEDLTQEELDDNQILSPSRQEGNESPRPMLVQNSHLEEIEQHKLDGSSDADAEPACFADNRISDVEVQKSSIVSTEGLNAPIIVISSDDESSSSDSDDVMVEENKTEEEEDLTQQELDENQILSPSSQDGNELPRPMLVENSVEEIEQHKEDGTSDADAEPEEEDLTQEELDDNQILSPSSQEGNELPRPMLVENSHLEEIEQHKVDGSSDADAEPARFADNRISDVEVGEMKQGGNSSKVSTKGLNAPIIVISSDDESSSSDSDDGSIASADIENLIARLGKEA